MQDNVEYNQMNGNALNNFVISGEEKKIQDIISDLKLIGKIRPNERIDAKNKTIVPILFLKHSPVGNVCNVLLPRDVIKLTTK